MISLQGHPIRDHRVPKLSPSLLEDMELGALLAESFGDAPRYLTTDCEAIRQRNAILQCLMADNGLSGAFEQLLNILTEIKDMLAIPDTDPVHVLGSMAAFRDLHARILALCDGIESRGDRICNSFTSLSTELRAFIGEFYPDDFIDRWNEYAQGIDRAGSLCYRVGFDADIHISSVALTGVYPGRYKKALFAKKSDTPGPCNVANLCSLVTDQPSDGRRPGSSNSDAAGIRHLSANINQLFIQQMEFARRWMQSRGYACFSRLGQFHEELAFYVNALRLIRRLSQYGLPLCFATIYEMGERVFGADHMYHPALAQTTEGLLTVNDAKLMQEGEIILLGGINRGGKTVFLRSACCVQLFFQMGLPVPASRASLCPASGIFSAFSRIESAELADGKLGQELTTVQQALCGLDSNGLFFFNEPISATSPMESYLLSKEVLCILKENAVRGIWVTHLFRLFHDIGDMNGALEGSPISCMHTSDGREATAEFKIFPGMPEDASGAERLFRQYVAQL